MRGVQNSEGGVAANGDFRQGGSLPLDDLGVTSNRDSSRVDQIIDVAKLGVSIRMAVAFSGLAIGLQAEVQLMQQLTNYGTTDRMTLRAQFGGEPTHALVCPAQWRLRIARGG
jgi:hypothetical protein